jgi:hypothetical protein
VGTKIRWFFIIVGILACLGVGSRFVELKDPNQPRLPIPTEMPGIPHVSVSTKGAPSSRRTF